MVDFQTVVIADDEPDMLQMISRAFDHHGFRTVTAEDGEAAMAAVRAHAPALAVLDLMMPKMSGLEVCRALRADPLTAGIPLVMLSACSSEIDRVVAFEVGVDDYVTKPFSPRELVLRVKAILRQRHGPMAAGERQVGEISLDRERHIVRVMGREIECTAIEFKLLEVLMEVPGKVHSRESLLQQVWGGNVVGVRTVDTQVRRLRARLGDAAHQIHTTRGFGYRLVEE